MLHGSRHLVWAVLAALSVGLSADDADAQHRRRRNASCEAPQHDSAGHCCNPGEEWVEARTACVCLDPGGCTPPPAPTPPPPPPPAPAAVAPSSTQPSPLIGGGAPASNSGGLRCPEGMVLVQGGPFMMGAVPGPGGASPAEGPPHRVTLAPYCIDRTEVTVRQYRDCVQSGACTVYSTVSFPGLSPADTQFFSQFCNGARSDRDTHPMNCVDFSQAEAYCRARGGALPTEAQWEFAARGMDPRRYPWDDRAPSAQLVNGCDAECQSLVARPGQPRRPTLFAGSDGFGATAPVGTYAGGASFFGVLDASGNVAEWTADYFGPYSAAPATDPTGPAQGSGRVMRGGHWFANTANQFTTTARTEVAPSTRLATLGLRCTHAPEAAPPPPPPPAEEPAPPPAEEPRPRRRRR